MSVIPKHNGKRVYQNYDPSIEGDFDVIVIGSGMGGMSCASALSNLGKKVLVLEQHYIPGGFTHMFGRKGYRWDVGVHVMGEMSPGQIPYKMLNWLTDGKVEMNLNGDPYEWFYFPHGFKFMMPAGEQKYLDHLTEQFPDDKKELYRYWKLVKKANILCRSFFLFQTFPKWLDKALSKVWHSIVPNYWGIKTADILRRFNMSDDLKLALTSHWGYYGSTPEESSFGVHAMTHVHFMNGASFPKGGAKEFAATMLGKVIDKGGMCLTKATVDEIILEDGKAIGVRMDDGKEFRAKKIVSAAGAKTTVNNLIPESFKDTKWANDIRAIEDSPSYLCLNLAFKGDIGKLGASGCNRWYYTVTNNDTQLWNVSNKEERPHLLYVSFPSFKDAEHQSGEDQKHTGECVTFVDWSDFKEWSESTFGDRPVDYEVLKQEITDRLLAELRIQMPEIMEHLEFAELSTPLTSLHYARASQGAIYGLAATTERFTCEELRVRTPIKNFYMSGVDIATLGVVAGMTTGILTACVIDKRAYLRLL